MRHGVYYNISQSILRIALCQLCVHKMSNPYCSISARQYNTKISCNLNRFKCLCLCNKQNTDINQLYVNQNHGNKNFLGLPSLDPHTGMGHSSPCPTRPRFSRHWRSTCAPQTEILATPLVTEELKIDQARQRGMVTSTYGRNASTVETLDVTVKV